MERNMSEEDKDERDSDAPLWCSCRLNLAVLTFFGFFNVYAIRANMSVAIVCMVNQTALCEMRKGMTPVLDTNSSQLARSPIEDCNDAKATIDEDGEFVWDKDFQGLVLSSFFYGYVVTNLPGGAVAERYGAKVTLTVSVLIGAIGTLLTPVAARTNKAFLIAMRILIGMATGPNFPTIAVMWSKWAPFMEKTMLCMSAISGAMLGNALTMPISGLLCTYGFDGGWPSIFYVFGATTCIWIICFVVVASENPETHPRMSDREKRYIIQNTDSSFRTGTKRKYSPPWAQILLSPPVWAISAVNVCFSWLLVTYMTVIPTYMYEDLHYDIKSNGFLSSLPFVCMCLALILLPLVVDKIRRTKILSTTSVRKICVAIGSVLPACILVAISFVTHKEASVAVFLLTLGLTTSGFQNTGFAVNPIDIAPRYAGTINGISNTLGTIPGMFVPSLVSTMTRDQTHEEWQHVFYMSAGVSLIGGFVFCLLGTAELQSWASDKENMSETVPILRKEQDV